MSATVEIQCEHCDEWFRSPIGFGRIKRRRIAQTLEGNLARCPHCREMTGRNNDNMRTHTDDGGLVAKDT